MLLVLLLALAPCGSAPAFAQAAKLDPEAADSSNPGFDENNLESYTLDTLKAYLTVYERSDKPEDQRRSAKIVAYLAKADPSWRKPQPTAEDIKAKTPRPADKTLLPSRKRITPHNDPATTEPGPNDEKTRTNWNDQPPGETSSVPPPTAPASVAPPSVGPAAPPSVASIAPPATPAPTPAGTETSPVAANPAAKRHTDWFNVAQEQMQSFWQAGGGEAGAAPKGMIYDPMSGKLVSINEHAAQVGVREAALDEIANTSSGAGAGTMKRLKDK